MARLDDLVIPSHFHGRHMSKSGTHDGAITTHTKPDEALETAGGLAERNERMYRFKPTRQQTVPSPSLSSQFFIFPRSVFASNCFYP